MSLAQAARPATVVRSDTARDHVDIVVVALIFACTLGRLIFLLSWPIDSVIYRITDDAYYYFKVAENIVAGLGVTVDGLNRTNGVHPLWLLVILPIYLGTAGDPDLSLRLVCCLQTVLCAGSFVLCWRYVQRLGGPWAAAVAVLIMLSPFTLNGMLNGLETGLLIFLLFVLVSSGGAGEWTDPAAPGSRKALFGLLLGMVCLCRLDMVFLVVATATTICVFATAGWESLRRTWNTLLSYWPSAVVFLGVVSPYFLWNWLSFRHLMPISGALKTWSPTRDSYVSQLMSVQLAPYSLALLITAAWAIGSLVWRDGYLRRAALPAWRGAGCTPFLVPLWLGNVIQYLYAILALDWALYWWHFASHVPTLSVLAGLGVSALLHRAKAGRIGMTLAAVLVAGATVGLAILERLERGANHWPRYQAALWLRENTRPDAVIAMRDSGLVGYFSRRPTVNLDGVINGYEYQAALAGGRLDEYLRRCRVTHFADYEVPVNDRTRHRIRLPARLARAPGYEIHVDKSAAIFTSPAYRPRTLSDREEPPVQFMIWEAAAASLVQR